MKLSAIAKFAAIGGIAALTLTSCAANEDTSNNDTSNSSETSETAAAPEAPEASSLSGNLVGAGASSQGAAQDAWIAGFQTANSDVTVTYDPSGSGAGRETFMQGGSAYAGSDAAFAVEDIEGGDFATCAADSGIVEFPAYISPIALIFNVDGVDSLKLDATTVAKIFSGEITKWNDSAIADQNEGVELPDQNITAVHRSDDSGTTENFTEYLAAAAGDDWSEGVFETWPTTYGGEGAQGTSGVVSAVKNGIGTIGYADASQAGELSTVEIKVGEDYVAYSPEAAAAIVDASPIAEGRGEHDLAIEIDRSSEAKGVYPIVLVSYLVGCETYEDAANAELVKGFFNYVISEDGQTTAADAAGSAPISADLRDKIQASVDSIA